MTELTGIYRKIYFRILSLGLLALALIPLALLTSLKRCQFSYCRAAHTTQAEQILVVFI